MGYLQEINGVKHAYAQAGLTDDQREAAYLAQYGESAASALREAHGWEGDLTEDVKMEFRDFILPDLDDSEIWGDEPGAALPAIWALHDGDSLPQAPNTFCWRTSEQGFTLFGRECTFCFSASLNGAELKDAALDAVISIRDVDKNSWTQIALFDVEELLGTPHGNDLPRWFQGLIVTLVENYVATGQVSGESITSFTDKVAA